MKFNSTKREVNEKKKMGKKNQRSKDEIHLSKTFIYDKHSKT